MLVNFDLHFHVKWATSSMSVCRLAILLGWLTVDASTRTLSLPAITDVVVMMSQDVVSEEFRLTQHAA